MTALDTNGISISSLDGSQVAGFTSGKNEDLEPLKSRVWGVFGEGISPSKPRPKPYCPDVRMFIDARFVAPPGCLST